MTRKTKIGYVLSVSTSGAVLGFIYAKHLVALAIAEMVAKSGWACGTGLSITYYFWTIVGAFIGGNLGFFTWPLFARMLNLPIVLQQTDARL